MGKPIKNKKSKVPKISEEEYAKSVASLKETGQVRDERQSAQMQVQNAGIKNGI